MNVRFIAADPRQKARPLLDELLERGVEQVAIACAFLTGGGAELLKRHAARLRMPDSFLVVAWEPPTTMEALQELHALFPGNLYLHLGAQTPVEKGVGRGLMHSKVLFARADSKCWVWTGSHNLTASASQGVNCEAAVVLEGSMEEQPFQHALAHLNQCKQEAVIFDPYNPPPPPPTQQTLVIHAECHVALKVPSWFVHLRPATTDYDRVMLPPGAVWLFLYSPGTLQLGLPRPSPLAAYSGTLTALNFTEYHPQRGIPADWQGADYVIEQDRGVFHFTDPKPHTKTPTQGVFRIEAQEDPSTLWLTESPRPKLEKIIGETRISELDPEFQQFFTDRSLRAGKLVHREYREMKPKYRVPQKDVGPVDSQALVMRLGMHKDTKIEIEKSLTKDKFAYIYRAKYRV